MLSNGDVAKCCEKLWFTDDGVCHKTKKVVGSAGRSGVKYVVSSIEIAHLVIWAHPFNYQYGATKNATVLPES